MPSDAVSKKEKKVKEEKVKRKETVKKEEEDNSEDYESIDDDDDDNDNEDGGADKEGEAAKPRRVRKQRTKKVRCVVCQKSLFPDQVEDHMAKAHPNQSEIDRAVTFLQAHPTADVAQLQTFAPEFGRFIVDTVPHNQRAHYDAALRIHSQLADIVKKTNMAGKGCELFMFGSTVSMGTWDSKGDLDLCLIDPVGCDNGTWPPAPAVERSLIFQWTAKLRRFLPADSLIPIGHGRVPIVKHQKGTKAYDAISMESTDFDLSARCLGIRNSWLIRRYMQQSSVARVGAVFVKKWSKAVGVNDSQHGYFTSYGVNIMWIHYLIQKKKVAFVHPIKDVPEYSPTLSPRTGTFLPLYDDAAQSDPETFQRELGETVNGFFEYYANEFDFTNDVVTISRTDVTKKRDMAWAVADKKSLGAGGICIEDPYEDRDLGKHGFAAEYIRGAIALSCVLLREKDTKGILPAKAAEEEKAPAAHKKKDGVERKAKARNRREKGDEKEKIEEGEEEEKGVDVEGAKQAPSRNRAPRRQQEKPAAASHEGKQQPKPQRHADPNTAPPAETEAVAAAKTSKPTRKPRNNTRIIEGVKVEIMAQSRESPAASKDKEEERDPAVVAAEVEKAAAARRAARKDTRAAKKALANANPRDKYETARSEFHGKKKEERKALVEEGKQILAGIREKRHAKAEAKVMAGHHASEKEARKCRHGAQCTTPNCPFKHPAGKAAAAAAAGEDNTAGAAPAKTAPARKNKKTNKKTDPAADGDDSDSVDVVDKDAEYNNAVMRDVDSSAIRSNACSNGLGCSKKGCKLVHPEGFDIRKNIKCKKGDLCQNIPSCPYKHDTKKKSEKNKDGEVKKGKKEEAKAN